MGVFLRTVLLSTLFYLLLSDSSESRDAGIELRTLALAVRRSKDLVRSQTLNFKVFKIRPKICTLEHRKNSKMFLTKSF